ncbi:MAG: tRNA (cytidine(56)-2'-O)-methyltransferase [Euryarchaeota archaeon]
MEIVILRLGHRIERDRRITTHVGLCSRALGAQGMLLAASDRSVVFTVRDVVERWGGNFWIRDQVNWRQEIAKWKHDQGTVVHLTMYGQNLPNVINRFETERLMVVVGAEKVPPDLFRLADYNVAITNQPHSEIAALSIFLDRVQSGRELTADFSGRTRIVGNINEKVGVERSEPIN